MSNSRAVDEGIDFVIGRLSPGSARRFLPSSEPGPPGFQHGNHLLRNKDQTAEGKTAVEAESAVRCRADVVGMIVCGHQNTCCLQWSRCAAQFRGISAASLSLSHTERQAGFHQLVRVSLCPRSLQLTRKEMADYALRARDIGINYIGACCGAVAMHIREMGRALGKVSEDSGLWKKGGEKPMSAYEYYDHDESASAGKK